MTFTYLSRLSNPYKTLFGKVLTQNQTNYVNPNYVIINESRRGVNYSSRGGSTIFEVNNGVGGAEAMLFAYELLSLYAKYFEHMRWPYHLVHRDMADESGIRSAKVIVSAPESYTGLIQEAGVHRVQRIPKTEKSGRMHTSTVTVSVTPESVLNIKLNDRDIDVSTKRSSGPGGQHVNKVETAIRLLHKPTGVVVECQESRHQLENRKLGMKKLLDKLQKIELDKISSEMSKMKQDQVGNANRNEKIRTYNFPQDRITDHRIGKTYHNLHGLFCGDLTILEKIIRDFNEPS